MNFIIRKLQAYRAEQERIRELEAEMQHALISSELIAKATIEWAQQRIAKAQVQMVIATQQRRNKLYDIQKLYEAEKKRAAKTGIIYFIKKTGSDAGA